jgi:hypothetical protein
MQTTNYVLTGSEASQMEVIEDALARAKRMVIESARANDEYELAFWMRSLEFWLEIRYIERGYERNEAA